MSRAKVSTVFGLGLFLCVLIQCANIASAATFTVGDSGGWTFNVNGWEKGKTFKAGDVLVFNYPAGVHTVVEVSKSNYDSCNPKGTVFSSGHDQITLSTGTSYFICGIGSHCASAGMKIAVTATS